MTCIKFFIGFKGRSTTTRDLYSRLKHLSTAQGHFQSAIDSRQDSLRRGTGKRGGGGGGRIDDVSPRSNKTMSVQEIYVSVCVCVCVCVCLCVYFTKCFMIPLYSPGWSDSY